MNSPAVTLRTGLYAEAITGLGLSATQTQALRDRRDDAATLAQAIRDALESARAQGLSTFAPDSGTLQVPSAVSLSELRDLFGQVIGRPYQAGDETRYSGLPDYGPLSLSQWSQAEEALALYVAREDSKLTPGAGGGPQYARGRWFVNGEPYSTAEVFLTVRMGSLGSLDGELAKDLNTLLVNTNLARDLMEVLADMKRRSVFREAQLNEPEPGPAYDPNAHYIIGDRVNDGGKTYSAISTNKGGTYAADAWYSLGDVVYYQGRVYQLTQGTYPADFPTSTKGKDPTDANYWTPVTQYSDSTKYDKGDAVLFKDRYYKLIKYDKTPFLGDHFTQGIEPTNTTFWSAPFNVDIGNSFLSGVAPTDTQYWAQLEARPNANPVYRSEEDFTRFVEAAGLTVPELMELGTRFKGANSYLNAAGVQALLTPPGDISSSLYNDAMTELQALFDSINAQNDVKKLRVDSLHNARTSVLEGMSALLGSNVQQQQMVGRNL